MNLSTTGLHLAADAAIDLQLHTVYSDGSWTPAQLLDHLVHELFGLVAILHCIVPSSSNLHGSQSAQVLTQYSRDSANVNL